MVDPLSIITGVLGVAAVALETSKKLFEMLESVKHSSQEIKTISMDAHAFYAVMYSMQQQLQNAETRRVIASDEGLTKAVESLNSPLRNCSTILGRIMVKVRGRVKPDKVGYKISSFDVKWLFSMKSELQGLTKHLAQTKSTLDSALTSLTTLCSLRLLAMGNQVQNPRIQDANAGFGLRRYVGEPFHASSIALSSPQFTPGDVIYMNDSLSKQEEHEEGNKSINVLRMSSGQKMIDDEREQTEEPFPVAVEPCNGAPTQVWNVVATLGAAAGSYLSAVDSLAACFVDLKVFAENEEPQDYNSQRDQTPELLTGVKRQNQALVGWLLNQGVNVKAENPEGQTALHVDLEMRPRAEGAVLQRGADVRKAQGPSSRRPGLFCGRTPLMWVATHDIGEVVLAMILGAAEIQASNTEESSALHLARKTGLLRTTRALLSNGASPSANHSDRWTPLHGASTADDRISRGDELVNSLVNRGSELEAVNSNGTAALQFAFTNSNMAVLNRLIGRGANEDCFNQFTDSPIHDVVWPSCIDNVIAFMDALADFNAQNQRDLNTPLHIAAMKDNSGIVTFLLCRGARNDNLNRKQRSPADLGLTNHGGDRKAVTESLFSALVSEETPILRWSL